MGSGRLAILICNGVDRTLSFEHMGNWGFMFLEKVPSLLLLLYKKTVTSPTSFLQSLFKESSNFYDVLLDHTSD